MITWSQTQQVPVLVFSAGLGESVLAAMKAANFLLPHVKVYFYQRYIRLQFRYDAYFLIFLT